MQTDPVLSAQTWVRIRMPCGEERGSCLFIHSQSQNSSQVSPTACPAPACAFGSGLGGEGPNHLLKVPRTGCENCCSQSWSTHCYPRPSTSPPALSLSHTHMQMHAWTQTAGRVVLPGTLGERRRACRAILSPTPPNVRLPLPAATIASSILD